MQDKRKKQVRKRESHTNQAVFLILSKYGNIEKKNLIREGGRESKRGKKKRKPIYKSFIDQTCWRVSRGERGQQKHRVYTSHVHETLFTTLMSAFLNVKHQTK